MLAFHFGHSWPSTVNWCCRSHLTNSSQGKLSLIHIRLFETYRCLLNRFFNFSWLNHVLHTNIVIFICLELFTTFRKYPSRKDALCGLVTFLAVYLAWIHIIKAYAGIWVYPVLEVLEQTQRIAFFAVILIFTLSLYFLGEYLNNRIWADELKQVKTGVKKHK